jgi:hypothetical protein
MGAKRLRGDFEVSADAGLRPPGQGAGAIRLAFRPTPGAHGLIPRYVALRADAGSEVPIPTGTTELGLFVHGSSTWAEVRLGVVNEKREAYYLIFHDRTARMADNFDGWQFLSTGNLGREVADGTSRVNRLAVMMPEQQVYVDDLVRTAQPQIAGLHAMDTRPPSVNYLPW